MYTRLQQSRKYNKTNNCGSSERQNNNNKNKIIKP